ncbi:MAG: histidine phosphatase family protein [Parvibaculum sp.]|nr:histidine phosphatase family protein [Parvibaculum sp.]
MLIQRPFYFLRHGETEWNRTHRAQGQIDIPLNETGVAQALRAAEVVRTLGVRRICASPLSRAFETARHSADAVGLPIEVVENLRECGLGSDEGRMHGGTWFADWRAGTYVPEGAETYAGFLTRVIGGVNDALTLAGDEPLLIVAHGGVYWSILHHAGLSAEQNAGNGEVMRFAPPRADAPGWMVERLG